jgi:hypothetical protein
MQRLRHFNENIEAGKLTAKIKYYLVFLKDTQREHSVEGEILSTALDK